MSWADYRDYIAYIRESGWWGTEEACQVWDKREGIRVARALGIPCPETVALPERCILKPVSSTMCKGIRVLQGAYLVQELLPAPAGSAVPWDVRFFTVAGEPRLLQVQRVLAEDLEAATTPGRSTHLTHHWLPSLQWVRLDLRREHPAGPCPLPAELVEEGIGWARALAAGFSSLRAVRVDFLYDGQRLLFGEMEATPGQFWGDWHVPEVGRKMAEWL